MSRQILLVCFGPLGRLLNALAAAQRLREVCPDDHLVLLTDPSLVGLASKAPWLNDIICADMGSTDLNLSHLAKTLKQSRYDFIIDLERSARTENLFSGFGLFPPKFAGSAPRAKWRLKNETDHPIDADHRLLDKIGFARQQTDPSIGPDLSWMLKLTGKTPSLQPGYFRLEEPYVLLNLGDLDATESWPEKAFVDLVGKILKTKTMVAITGTIKARDLARPVLRAFPEARDLCARADPFQLAALGASASGVVGLPDGILHLCAAGAVRSISLHGSPQSVVRNAIRSPNAMTLIAEPLETLSADDVVRAMKMFGAL